MDNNYYRIPRVTNFPYTFSRRYNYYFLKDYLKRLNSFLVDSFATGTSFLQFLIFLAVYSRRKAWQFVLFLEKSKELVCSWLMWRRGLLFRPVTHTGVVSLTLIALVAGTLLSNGKIEAQNLVDSNLLISGQSLDTEVPANRPRAEIIEYKVEGGDTISGIAAKFDVSIETVKWTNKLDSVDSIAPGDTLKIPPVTGVVHQVKQGENLDSIAKKYSADAQTIVDFPFNYIDDSLSLKVGENLVVPNGVMPEPPKPKNAPAALAKVTGGKPAGKGSGILRWPLTGGISQYPSWWHPGAIDITANVGSAITAADSGKVVTVLKQWYGYGWHIVIDHGNGYTTLYAHLSAIYVYPGEGVSKGQVIGAVGMTGRSTGPHLHFETRKGGSPVNPLSLLP